MISASKLYLILLVIWSIVMLGWGLAGFFEYFTLVKPVIALQNNAYPSGVQFIHWFLISTTGLVFGIGYFTRWKTTPYTMLILFSNLAILCTIETFDFMSEHWSLKAYLSELTFYLVTSLFLLYSTVSKSHFIS